MTSGSVWGAPPGYLKHVPGIRELHAHPEPEGFALPLSSAPGGSFELGLDLMLVPWGLLQAPLMEGGPTAAHPTCIEWVSTVVTPNGERVSPSRDHGPPEQTGSSPAAAWWTSILGCSPGAGGGLAPPIFTGSSALTASGGPPGPPVGKTESRGP